MSEEHDSKPFGRGMMFLFWIALMAVLWLFASDFEKDKYNPNRNLQTETVGDRKQVTLKSARHGHYIASGEINGQPVTFMVDTGASVISIPEPVAKRLRLEPGPKYRAVTANGEVLVASTMLSEVRLGDIVLYDVRASINPGMGGEEILLGMSFLRNLELRHANGELTISQ